MVDGAAVGVPLREAALMDDDGDAGDTEKEQQMSPVLVATRWPQSLGRPP